MPLGLRHFVCLGTLLWFGIGLGAACAGDDHYHWRYRLQHRHGQDLHHAREAVLNDTLLDLQLKYHGDTNWQLDALARARYEDRLEPDSESKLELREFILSREADDYSLKLGRQQVVWGKTDGLRLLDVINPLELREFILVRYSDSRIPLWMVNALWYPGDDTVQALVIPDIRHHRLADPGSRFYIAPSVPAGMGVSSRALETPPTNLNNTQYALKWAGQRGAWELTLNAFYGWTQAPIYFYHLLSPTSLELQPALRRQRLLGASGDRPFGRSVFRFETVYTPDDYRAVNDPTAVGGFRRQRRLSLALGLDWYWGEWLISPQWFQQRLIQPDPQLQGPQSESYTSLLIHRKLMQDRLELEIFYLYGNSNGDRWFAPSLHYQIAGRYTLGLKADLFQGPANSLFGQFDNNDRILFSLEAQF